MNLISVPLYTSSRDAQSRAVFVSGRQMNAASSFNAVMKMDEAPLVARIQIYDFVQKRVSNRLGTFH